MKYIIMLRLVWLIPLAIFSINLSAQVLDPNLSELNKKSLDFEKQAFVLKENDSAMAHVLLNKVYFFKSHRQFNDVIKTAKRALSLSITKEQRIYFSYELALSYYYTHELVMSENTLLPLLNKPLSDSLKHASIFLYVIVLHDLGRWTEAKSQLLFYFNDRDNFSDSISISKQHEIESIYSQNKIPTLKNLKKARTRSLIFPGLGQYYNGNIGAGLLNTSLVGLSGLFAYYNYVHHAYFTGSLGGLYLISTFYFGGVNQLNDLVLQKNNKRIRETNAKLNARLIGLFKL